jgi:hypothetical protein
MLTYDHQGTNVCSFRNEGILFDQKENQFQKEEMTYWSSSLQDTLGGSHDRKKKYKIGASNNSKSRDMVRQVKMGPLNPCPRCVARKAMTIIHPNPKVRTILHDE